MKSLSRRRPSTRSPRHDEIVCTTARAPKPSALKVRPRSMTAVRDGCANSRGDRADESEKPTMPSHSPACHQRSAESVIEQRAGEEPEHDIVACRQRREGHAPPSHMGVEAGGGADGVELRFRRRRTARRERAVGRAAIVAQQRAGDQQHQRAPTPRHRHAGPDRPKKGKCWSAYPCLPDALRPESRRQRAVHQLGFDCGGQGHGRRTAPAACPASRVSA